MMVDTERTQTAPRLPTELLAEITRHVAKIDFGSKSLLCTLARTSRVFSDLAEPELYRDVGLHFRDVGRLPGNMVNRAKTLCMAVIGNAEKAALVRRVTVRQYGRWGSL